MGKKKPIVSSLGQWAYPGEVTIIPSNSITMKGVGYPVLGVDNLGNQQMMMPGADYTFPGDYVTEYPQMQFGGMSKRKIDKILNQNKDLNFVQRMYQPNTPSIIIPGQPYPATHFMESADGLVYPTVVQMSDGSLQYLGDNAYNYANQTGEYIEFPNDRQARRFAKNYKKGTGVLEEFGKGGLTQWFAEEWTDVKTGKPCGRSGKDKDGRPYPACRPKKRVNETTPKTTSEMSSAEKAKFKREKTSGKRIDYNHKRRQLGGQEDSTMENIAEFFDPTGYTSWDDANRAYNEWKKSNSVLPSMSQALDMFGAVPALGKFGKLKYLDPNSIKTAYKAIPWQQILNAFDTAEDEISKTKKKYGGWLEQYQEGGFRYTPPSRRAFTTSYQQPTRSTSDNTRVVTPNVSDATRAMVADQRAKEAAAKRSGVIYAGTPESDYEKAKRAASFVEQSKLRDGFATPLDYVLDVVNPATYAFSATDIADNTAKAAYNVSQGEFTAAGSNLLDAGLNTLDFIPVAKGSGKFLKGAVRYGDDVLQTSKMVGKPSLPKYKDVYRAEHAGFNQVATPQDITGRWAANSADEASYYVQNLKDPTTGKVMNAFSGEQVPVRIMKQRVPEYKYNQQFAEGMPEEARIMSMGPGRLSRTELDQVLGPGATKRFETNQFSNQDLAAMQTAPFLFNPNEGILDAGIINNLRQGKNTLSGRASVFATQNQAADYLLNQTKSKQNVSSLNKYLPFNTFQMGGMSISGVNGIGAAGVAQLPEQKYGGWLDSYQEGGESDIRMEPIQINTQQSPWYIRYPRKALRAIDNKLTDWGAQYSKRISDATGGKDWYKEANPFGSLALEFMNAPQYTATYGVTGKVQTPSEAMDIQNPVGAFLTDAVLDPTNLVGAGIAKNLGSDALRNMIRNRSRGTRPDFTPNVSNQLPDPPSELILNPNTGQLDAYYDSSRPYFDEWVRMMNNNATNLDISNLFANNRIDVASSIDLRKLKKSKNLSGLTKDDILKNASPKDKEVLSKMSESEFEQTVLKPTGEIAVYEPAINLGLGFNTNTRNLTLRDSIPMGADEYTDIFNSRLDRLNEIISRNNKSGLDYSVKELSPSGVLRFNTPAQIEKLPVSDKVINELKKRGLIDSEGNMSSSAQEYVNRWTNRNIPQGESTWMLDINPGQWRGEVEDIANAEYFKAIPGLNMRNTTASVFSDALPRRGTGAYSSINQYLKELDLGRVKPGFNSQTESSSRLWQDAIKKGKAFGYFNDPTTVYGSMRTFAPLGIGAAAASQLPEQKYGGWLNKYK